MMYKIWMGFLFVVFCIAFVNLVLVAIDDTFREQK